MARTRWQRQQPAPAPQDGRPRGNLFIATSFLLTQKQQLSHSSRLNNRRSSTPSTSASFNTDMDSIATGQSPPHDPHRPGEQIVPQHSPGPDSRRCRACRLTKPLQDFKGLTRRKQPYVTTCISCREQQRSRRPVIQNTPQVSGTKRTIGQVDGPTAQPLVARHRPIAPRTAAADFDKHGSPVFHRRGVRPDDTPVMQQARRDQGAISRAHRAQARDDLQPSPSQTPSLPDIIRGRQELDALHRRHEQERMAGASPSPTPGLREHFAQQRGHAASPSLPFNSQSLRSPSVAAQTPPMTESLASDYHPSSLDSRPEPSFPLGSRQSPLPPVSTPDAEVTLDDMAIPAYDKWLIDNWTTRLGNNVQQRCNRCKCYWFDLDVDDSGICKGCRKADKIYANPRPGQRGPGMPELWSADNKLDLGEVPAHLPQLDQIEEWLIARVHVHIQIWTYRGSQYHYKGHIISFLKDVGTVYDTLPLLPSELDTIVVRPRNTTTEPGMIRQFRSAFRVRREAIAQWLDWLVNNNPLYRDVVVDPERLRQLPVDGDVSDQLPTIEADAVQAEQDFRDAAATDNDSAHSEELWEDNDGIDSEEPWESAAVPHLMAHQTDVDAFKEQILQGPNAPASQSIPLRPASSGIPLRRLGRQQSSASSQDSQADAFNPPPPTASPEGSLAMHSPSIQSSASSQNSPIDASNRLPTSSPEGSPALRIPSIRQTPIDELGQKEPLLALAFPTLYPHGIGDFVEPRLRSVDFKAYYQRALKLSDGRFARHPKFRYVVYNMWARSQTNKTSTYYLKKDRREDITIEKLREMFNQNSDEAQSLLKSITRYAGNMLGTRPYWLGKRHELAAMVRGLGCPSLFMTFSAADLHWESLAKVMPNYEAWAAATNEQKIKLASINLKNNPHIAAYHFMDRFQSFMKDVVIEKFGVEDYWWRVEFQARGSPHVHMVVWLRDCPTLDEKEGEVAADVEKRFLDFFKDKVTSWNYTLGVPPAQDTNPLIRHEDFSIRNLSAILNRVQVHMCTDSYCLRAASAGPGHQTGEKGCRFHFPKELHPEPMIVRTWNPTYGVYDGSRNDQRMNHYNATLTLGWLANTDISPCISALAVINYIVKYVSKAEKKTETFNDVAAKILARTREDKGIATFVNKFMNVMVAERDISAQEVMHILLGLLLSHSSRTIYSVDCRTPDQHWKGDVITRGDQIHESVGLYAKYLKRPDGLSDMSYFKFVQTVDWTASEARYWHIRPRAKPRILNYFPIYQNIEDTREDYARVKLMLHHPHRRFEDLKKIDGVSCATYVDAYQHCQQHHPDHPYDYYGRFEEPEATAADDEHAEEYTEQDEDVSQEAWQELANMIPRRAPDEETVQVLGNRDIDLNCSWVNNCGRYAAVRRWIAAQFYQSLKSREQPGGAVVETQVDYASQLNNEQRAVWHIFRTHAREVNQRLNPAPILMQVDGAGGTGKSFLIHAVSDALETELPGSVVRAAPTGIAANAIEGQTIHSLLRLPIARSETLSPLEGSQLGSVRAAMINYRYLILDEKSMIGLRTLHNIDQRLRQIHAKPDAPFGGMSILLLGDFAQLPPVFDKPLYKQASANRAPEVHAQLMYEHFDRSVFLKQVVRQAGDSQKPFRDVLAALRDGNPTPVHFDLLCTRIKFRLPSVEVARFQDALRIYPTNAQVDTYNREHLEKIRRPIINIACTDTGTTAIIDSRDAGNLQQQLSLCIGAKVMLTENIWTAKGLVNGAIGTVVDLAWNEGSAASDLRRVAPTILLVHFDSYTGPPVEELVEDATLATHIARHFRPDEQARLRLNNIVPIFRSRRDFIYRGRPCTRTQFPLTVAYAITVHKSQGCTLDKAVTDISGNDFIPGLTYVAVSRVKSLEGIMFDSPFDLQHIATKPNRERLADFDRRKTNQDVMNPPMHV